MRILFTLIFGCSATFLFGQTAGTRAITLDEYSKAKSFTIASLDNDSYVKFENTYILDRYEGRKPIFITGEDGLKKRMDLYKLIAKENMQELGLMVFYTNEKSKIFKALVPNYSADGKVWEQYFEDIHAIDKEEKNFVLKLSYVLSRELSFQQYKNLNGGKDIKDEHATYGNDICFPGDQTVNMANGDTKLLKDVKAGDEVITIDPATHETKIAKVNALLTHEAKNYAVSQLTLVSDVIEGDNIYLHAKLIKATPNHPMLTNKGEKKMGDIKIGEEVFCLNEKTQKMESFKVLHHKEFTEGEQKVYNIDASLGTTMMLNGVMVKQK